MSEKSIDQFQKIDPEKISGFLLETFSSEIEWTQASFEINEKVFGVFKIEPSTSKPVIARKDEGKNQAIKNGEIYYRYGGRTQKIQGAELESIIFHRIEQNNRSWLDLMSKIGRMGPQNAAILDTESGLIEKNENQIMVVDETLASKLKFIKQGEFVEKGGSTALQLVGDVVPVDQVEVVKRVKEHLTKNYPLSALELAEKVKSAVPETGRHEVWACIRENDIKNNPDYAAYNFRNKKQEDEFKETGKIPKATPSIYNHAAVEFIAKILKNKPNT
ncbi:hypothetical protein AUR63_01350 [Guyparkeria sp. XI15]|nr:hypothetical protein AUR63_01350 [Guyparkeria sp. XI15]OAE85773.1 hypothetical protein AWR35_01350 [Guyparkeria sp. WRN-7]